jgi:uncharacterized delta-60 repeat protein
MSLATLSCFAALTSFMRTKSKARKVASLLLSVAALLSGAVPAAHGVSTLDGFNPNANGVIRAVVVQPNGKILLGGDFTALSPNGGAEVTRNRIARLNPDGTIDTAFNPNANSNVRALVVQPDGKILAGGDFTTMSGEPRNRLVRLDGASGAADSFDPNVTSVVRTLALQADGKILVGGDFTSVEGETRNFIARLNATSGSLDSFNPNANGPVRCIVVQTNGKILVGGQFNGENGIGGEARNYLARLDPATGLADSFHPNANAAVFSIAVQTDGKILAGGFFHGANSIGGQPRNRLARLNAATGVADSFNPNADGEIYSIALQANEKILVGGKFSSVGGLTRRHLARLNSTTGAADASFNSNANAAVFSIAVQTDGKILAGGAFMTIVGQPRGRIARFVEVAD